MKRVLFMAVCAAWLGFSCTSSKIEVDELRVELRENPVGSSAIHVADRIRKTRCDAGGLPNSGSCIER